MESRLAEVVSQAWGQSTIKFMFDKKSSSLGWFAPSEDIDNEREEDLRRLGQASLEDRLRDVQGLTAVAFELNTGLLTLPAGAGAGLVDAVAATTDVASGNLSIQAGTVIVVASVIGVRASYADEALEAGGLAARRSARRAGAREAVGWVDETASMSRAARRYDSGALGARSSLATRRRQVPFLELDGSPVRFDGFDGKVLIDRKCAVTFFPKAKAQALRQSEVLRLNGYRGLWEVPSGAERNRAIKLFRELGIDNIDVEIVP